MKQLLLALAVVPMATAQFVQQGDKLVAQDGLGTPTQGWSAALSADGNTALLGGHLDRGRTGAAWVFTRSEGKWNFQTNKLVGTGTGSPMAYQGWSMAIYADGNTGAFRRTLRWIPS